MSVKERLKKFIIYKRMNDRQFSLSIGVSAGYVNSISKSIQPDKLNRITALYPELNTGWLLTGEGQMIIEPSTDLEGLDENFTGREVWYAFRKELLKTQEEHTKELAKLIEFCDELKKENLELKKQIEEYRYKIQE